MQLLRMGHVRAREGKSALYSTSMHGDAGKKPEGVYWEASDKTLGNAVHLDFYTKH